MSYSSIIHAKNPAKNEPIPTTGFSPMSTIFDRNSRKRSAEAQLCAPQHNNGIHRWPSAKALAGEALPNVAPAWTKKGV
jgi:hypothetical protein